MVNDRGKLQIYFNHNTYFLFIVIIHYAVGLFLVKFSTDIEIYFDVKM